MRGNVSVSGPGIVTRMKSHAATASCPEPQASVAWRSISRITCIRVIAITSWRREPVVNVVQDKFLCTDGLSKRAGHTRDRVSVSESGAEYSLRRPLVPRTDFAWDVCIRRFVDKEGRRGAQWDDRGRVVRIAQDDKFSRRPSIDNDLPEAPLPCVKALRKPSSEHRMSLPTSSLECITSGGSQGVGCILLAQELVGDVFVGGVFASMEDAKRTLLSIVTTPMVWSACMCVMKSLETLWGLSRTVVPLRSRPSAHRSAYASAYRDPADLCLRGSERSEWVHDVCEGGDSVYMVMPNVQPALRVRDPELARVHLGDLCHIVTPGASRS
ncbi:hypothetical protein B0H14DRAFT_2580675 [Mycena olivaceomarginata]|nr:hypothetical protein B0H14DRAFT_2580675 [Mycena olivaceomarginata]